MLYTDIGTQACETCNIFFSQFGVKNETKSNILKTLPFIATSIVFLYLIFDYSMKLYKNNNSCLNKENFYLISGDINNDNNNNGNHIIYP